VNVSIKNEQTEKGENPPCFNIAEDQRLPKIDIRVERRDGREQKGENAHHPNHEQFFADTPR
jgi:hypothetical protein